MTTVNQKRRYTRLDDETWATIRSEWESGGTTLADLADRFKTSIRSIQNHFEKHSVTKGSSKVAATSEALRLMTPSPSPAGPIDADEAKADTLRRVLDIEAAIGAQLDLIRLDPSQAYRAGSAVKMLAAAADGLTKAYALKAKVLGLDREEAQSHTILEIRELFPDEIERLRAKDKDDDEGDDDLLPDDDDEVISLEDLTSL
ncbi:hypothetical protein [Aureimonas psammosilenae]|uniref:hypothetical protein n=1 Tax=Aureimonas psammosilenae TaxID=2495496 RepID=UPI0012611027|nr:hypothetical protein [Aureimonas psammosilenae]